MDTDLTTELTALFAYFQQPTETFGAYDIVLTIMVSFGLSLIIASTYKFTYRGVTYTQSYVQTLIIGSSIARAFTLVGALSIIRFRNAIRDTRDVGYIFFAMAIGMACGMRLYSTAVISTVMICFILWAMFALNLFASNEQILKLRLPYDNLFDGLFARYLERFDFISMEAVQSGMMTELVYEIRLKKQTSMLEFLNGVRSLTPDKKILIAAYHNVDGQ